VLVLLILIFGMGGNGDETGTGPQGTAPAVGTGPPATTTQGEPTATAGTPKGSEPTVDDLEKLLADAKYEENTGNWREALYLYRRLLSKTPYNHPLNAQAREAVRLISEQFKDEDEEGAGIQRKRFVSNEESEATGAQFDENWPGWVEKLKWFQVEQPLAEMRALVDSTREETPERRRIEGGILRAEAIEKLLSILEGRAEGLPLEKARWSNIDFMASGSLLIMDADATGVKLKDEASDMEETRYWASLGFGQMLAVVELLRNPKSAEEALLVGYLCVLHNDARAESYFRFAEQIDGSPEMRQRIKELREPLSGEE